jgi:hypothetical protein
VDLVRAVYYRMTFAHGVGPPTPEKSGPALAVKDANEAG